MIDQVIIVSLKRNLVIQVAVVGCGLRNSTVMI